MNEDVYQRLVETARAGTLINYSDLVCVTGLEFSRKEDSDEFGKILDEIADRELAAGRPLLPIVVIRDDTKMPARGLFRYAKAKRLQKNNDDLVFFAEELKRVYAEWKPPK